MEDRLILLERRVSQWPCALRAQQNILTLADSCEALVPALRALEHRFFPTSTALQKEQDDVGIFLNKHNGECLPVLHRGHMPREEDHYGGPRPQAVRTPAELVS